MEGAIPAKASAFAIVRRPDGRLLCTLEGPEGTIGLPGGKWEPRLDGRSWARLLGREYAEEVGAPLPRAARAGYLEWGSDAYQVRFWVAAVDEAAAAAIPTGASRDPSGSVREVRWLHPSDALAGPVRPHVEVALRVLCASPLVARETARKPAHRYALEDVYGA